jgi:hypothetical protein
MLSVLKSRFRKIVDRNTRYQNLAFAACLLFGLMMIANVQIAGDGGWYWYAVFFRAGKRLYADMHLALQPLFVLETALSQAVFGISWLASKIPAILHLTSYCVAMLLLIRSARISDFQKAVVLGCAFFVSISFEAFRFDDYHVLADCFVLYSLLLLLLLPRATGIRHLAYIATLGILTGLTLTTRINDGAALALAICICIIALVPTGKLISIPLFAVSAAFTLFVVIHLTGDSLHDYATYSIFKAAGSKGGSSHVIAYPLQLPLNTLIWLTDHQNRRYLLLLAYIIAVALSWVFLLSPLARRFSLNQLLKAALGACVILLPLPWMYRFFLDMSLVMTLSAVAVLASYVLGIIIIFRLIRSILFRTSGDNWNRTEILLLVPLSQLASGSMSSAGTHLGLYDSIGILILLLPIVYPAPTKFKTVRPLLFAIATMLMCASAIYRFRSPFAWHSYTSPRMFADRHLYHHPVYGPMIIDTQLLSFIHPVCKEVDTSDARAEFLSLPLPYANYFCDSPPWHGYIQTFFDTSSKETILGLIDELKLAPPKLVLYQRQLDNLARHERAFNHGQPLAHRALDDLIMQKIADKQWQIVYSSSFEDRPGSANQWILVRTRP